MKHVNKNCLRIETKKYSYGLFDKSVDATYIIHLENNGRLPSINKQLEHFKPTNIVHIVYNKGYTKCDKKLEEQTPTYDLFDTFIYIFKDANEKGYNNILVLEDDFIFTKKIYNKEHLNNINNFIIEHQHENMLYYLGCLLWLQMPYNEHTNKNIISSGTHSVVYSYAARKRLLNQNNEYNFDWDIYTNRCPGINRYVYYTPLCYQLFPETKNSEHWYSPFKDFNPLKMYIKMNNLNKTLEPGYSNTYIFSKIMGYFLLFLILIIIIVILIIMYNFFNKTIIYSKKLINKNY